MSQEISCNGCGTVYKSYSQAITCELTHLPPGKNEKR